MDEEAVDASELSLPVSSLVDQSDSEESDDWMALLYFLSFLWRLLLPLP